MDWKTIYLIAISCIALQSIIRDIANLCWLLNTKRKKRTVDIDLIKKRVAGVYEDDDDE